MFDVGFWELLLVGLVALLAFGPNELPRLVRDTVRVMRKLRAAATAAGDELRRELRLDELDQPPRPGSSLGQIHSVVDEVRQLAHEVRPGQAGQAAAQPPAPETTENQGGQPAANSAASQNDEHT